MKSTRVTLLIYGLILIIGQAYAAEVAVIPSNQIITPGAAFNMNISIDPQGTAIAGAQLNIAFNRSLIRVNSITEGDLFKQNGANTFFNSGIINNSAGTVINIFNAIIGKKNVSTTGTFIIINATAIGTSGTSGIDLSNVKISDPNGNPVGLNVTKGSVTVGDATTPASISNLKNSSYAQYFVKWTWTDPTDADFSRVMVYLNGVFKGDVYKGTKYYNATDLMPGMLYTISTRTVDIAGNINKTWVNHTARTALLPDTTPPAGVTALINSTYEKTYINWTWADPLDADFSKVMIYLNGKFKTNVTKGVQFYKATGLSPNTVYTISTHTVDTAGNINQTWVNHTARTAPRQRRDA